MKIQVGKYIINSDKLNWWIDEEYEISKGKHKGETDIRHLTGYCWTFEKCLKNFRERTLGESGATTLLELLEALRSIFEDMDTINRAKFEADVKKLEEVSK